MAGRRWRGPRHRAAGAAIYITDTQVQAITGEDIGDELKSRGQEHAQEYAINRLDEKLGERMSSANEEDMKFEEITSERGHMGNAKKYAVSY